MERKKTNEVYFLSFEQVAKTGRSHSTRGKSFLWEDVIYLTQSSIIPNCTQVKTVHSEFTINEHFEAVDSEWQAYLIRQKLGIPKPNE